MGMADCKIGHVAGQVLATYALGSCIGLSVYVVPAKAWAKTSVGWSLTKTRRRLLNRSVTSL